MSVWNSECKLIIFKILHGTFAKIEIFGCFHENERFSSFWRKVELILAPYEAIRWKGLKGSKESIFLKFRIKKIWSFGFHENLRFLGFFEKFGNLNFLV